MSLWWCFSGGVVSSTGEVFLWWYFCGSALVCGVFVVVFL